MNVKLFDSRMDWQREVEMDGLPFHTVAAEPYWVDDRAFQFTTAQVDRLRSVTEEVWQLFLAATEFVITRDLLEDLGIPEWIVPAIKRSWDRRDPSIYGRFDFIWNGIDAPKVIEFNADTPTSLVESSVIQSAWLQRRRSSLPPGVSQFNELKQSLIEAWIAYRDRIKPRWVHFTHMGGYEEDRVTTDFMHHCAASAGIMTKSILLEKIGFDGEQFSDLDGSRIDHLFKLYPWDDVWLDEFGPALLDHPGVIEPLWKFVMDSKGLLPIIFRSNSDHPNLLETSFARSDFGEDFVKKPKISRLGANITLHAGRVIERTPGGHDSSGYIYQRYQKMPATEYGRLLVGSWIANGKPCGMSLRETDTHICNTNSRFIPHFVTPE